MERDDQRASWLSALAEEHGRALVLYARQWCDCAEDVVQDALLQLVVQRRRPERAAAWLFRVVRNGAISAGRSSRRRAERERRSAASEAWFDNPTSFIDVEAATAALYALPPELREVVVARIWGNLTYNEIAELTETSSSTAQRRYEQGLRTLQTQLDKPCTTENRSTPT